MDVANSHSLGEMVMKGLKGTYNFHGDGLRKAVKSEFAKQKIKGMADKYLDKVLDSVIRDISRNLDPLHRGGTLDIHKMIG